MQSTLCQSMYFYFYYAVTIVSFWIESYFNCVGFIQDLQDISALRLSICCKRWALVFLPESFEGTKNHLESYSQSCRTVWFERVNFSHPNEKFPSFPACTCQDCLLSRIVTLFLPSCSPILDPSCLKHWSCRCTECIADHRIAHQVNLGFSCF